MLIAESPDGNYSRRKNAGLMPGRGATRRSGRTWHLDLRHHARWLPDCQQTGSCVDKDSRLVTISRHLVRKSSTDEMRVCRYRSGKTTEAAFWRGITSGLPHSPRIGPDDTESNQKQFPPTGLLASVHRIHIDMWRVIRSSELGLNDYIQRSKSVVPI